MNYQHDFAQIMHIGLFSEEAPIIQFMEPQGKMSTYGGTGVALNFKVDDVDAEYAGPAKADLESVMPLNLTF